MPAMRGIMRYAHSEYKYSAKSPLEPTGGRARASKSGRARCAGWQRGVGLSSWPTTTRSPGSRMSRTTSGTPSPCQGWPLRASAEVIVFCGVHFMAETAKLLAPDRTVLLPDLRAGCSLAETVTAEDVRRWRGEHPGGLVVAYVNTSAAVKAESDYCCTSSNAVDVVASLPEDREVLFLPDMFLGQYVARRTKRPPGHLDGRMPRPCRHNASGAAPEGRRGPHGRAVHPPRMRLHHERALAG